MKTPRFHLQAILAALFMLRAAAPAQLLLNPGFEQDFRAWRVTEEDQFASIDRPKGSHGKCVKLAPIDGKVGVETARLLRDGVEIDLTNTYQISARIRLADITKGAFNAMLYAYDQSGRYVAMKTYFTARAPAKAMNWRTIRLTFGPRGVWRPPQTVAQIKVRFSFWSKDGECSGAAWIDDVDLREVQAPDWSEAEYDAKQGPAGALAVWVDESLARRPACGLAALEKIAESAGLAVNRLSTSQLCQSGVLSPKRFTALVLPYGPAFPVEGKIPLLRYLRGGGDLLALGGAAFEEPLVRVGDRWGTPADFLEKEKPGVLVADFESDAPELLLEHRAKDARGRAEITRPGAAGSLHALRYSTPDLAAFEYVGLATSGLRNAALCFYARGDRNTPLLSIEAQETDGSRWKAMVRLRKTWRRYVLHASDFFSYATPNRAGPKDHFHPERAAKVYFGLIRKMFEGPHGFEIDDVRWAPCALPAGDLRRRAGLAPLGAMERYYYGSKHLKGAAAVGPLNWFDFREPERQGATFEAADALSPAGPPHWAPAKLRRPTAHRVIGDVAAALRGRRRGPWTLPPGVRVLSLLRSPEGVAGQLRWWTDWPFPGAACAVVGLEQADLSNPALQRLVAAILQLEASGPCLTRVRPVFVADEARGCLLRAEATAVNNSCRPASVAIRLACADSDASEQQEKSIRIGPERVQKAAASLRAERFGASRYTLSASLGEQQTVTAGIDTRAAFRKLADWFVAHQREDGKFSGITFVDNRGARGLLAAYEIFHDKRYRSAALRWADAVVKEQRRDGGFLMGYGDQQGICYVADGGEIAVGVARALRYADPDRKRRYRAALEAYRRFRESFRNEKGEIGVGWCLHDYIENKRFPKLTREMRGRPFTIGCTLGFAGALASLSPDAASQAAADARWFLDHKRFPLGVAAEGLMWVHRFSYDPELKEDIGERFLESFLRLAEDSERVWWVQSGGRSAVNLTCLAYVYQNLKPDPRLLAAIKRAEWAMLSPSSPTSLFHAAQSPSLQHDDWIYLCYSLVSIPELIEPGVTLKPLE